MLLDTKTNKFELIGGNVSLDFVNTADGRISNPNKKIGRDYYDVFPSNKMENYTDLVAWSLKTGLFEEKEVKSFCRLLKIIHKWQTQLLKEP